MKINRLFFCALAVAAIAVSCEDEKDLALPEISADQTVLSFTQDGGAANAQTVYITSNRDWTASCDADWVIITPESGLVSDETVEVTVYVDANNETDRSATITFETSTVWTTVTVNQAGPGGSVESTYVYSNDFDKEAATQTYGSSSSSWPYLDQFDGWQNETGSGASTVSYNYANMSVRDNSNSNGSYSNYEGSGTNNLFFGSTTNYFVVQGITLPTGTVNYSLSFGSEKYEYGASDNTFNHNEFHVYISDNGERWVELSYTFPNGDQDGTWDQASTNFTVPDGTTTLYIYFTADVASDYRLDDVLLATSTTAGTSIDFSTGVTDLPGSGEGTGGSGGEVGDLTGSGTADDPYTVADALAIINAGAYTSSNVYVSGIIAGDPDIDTSYGNATYYISDDGTTTDQIEVFRGYYLGGEKFTSTDQIKAGDAVVVCGELTMYYETPEITTGSSIYSLNGEGGGGGGDVDLTDPYTTSVTWTAIEHAETNDVVIINDTEYNNVLKLGTGSYAGSGYCTVPSGTKSFVFYCLGWNNKSNVPFTVTVGDVYTNDYTANGNSGVNNNTPFTLNMDTVTSSDFYVINLDSALTADTKITIATTDTSNGRVIVFGAKYFDTDQEGGDDNGNGGGDTVETEGAGTADDPYTVADAIAICAAGTYTSDNVYVKGIISQIDEISTSFGNATYYISDDGTTTSQFEIFRGYSLNGASFTSETEIEVGDKVVVCGVLTNYSGTYEMTTGSSIYSLEKGEGGGSGGGDDNNGVETTGDGTQSNPYTADDVYALYNAGSLPSTEVYVKGVVCEWGSYSSSYQDMTYYISDDGSNTGNRVEIYNGYGLDGEKVTYDNYLHVGDKVVVCGTLTYYTSYSIIEFSSGSKITSLEQADYCDVSSSSISVNSDAGSTTFTVSSNISWTASSDNSDFTVSPTSGSSGQTTVTVSYTANTGSARTATITVASSAGNQTVTINQGAAGQKTITWANVGSSYQTWTEDTHATYGAGYAATQDGMTVGYYKANYANDLVAPSTDHIRVYKAAELIIDVADATKITKVVLTLTNKYTYDIVVDSGTTSVDSSNYIVTWEGSVSEFDANATNGQLRIYGIEVTYE